MHSLKKILSYVQPYLRLIPLTTMRRYVGQWLKKYQLFVGLLLLGLIVLKLTWGQSRLVILKGDAMGTYYCIKYLDRWGRSYQKEIEDLLGRLEHTLSTDVPDSELVRFNAHDCSEFHFESPFFYPVFAKSKEVYRQTSGAFDPTILPLVNAWVGSPAEATDSENQQINLLREYVSLDYVVANGQRIKKLKEGVKLDFRGILRGYAVDQIAALLCTHDIENAWIALGNEILMQGKPSQRRYWQTEIHPHVGSLVGENLQITMELVDKAIAISSQQLQGSAAEGQRIDPATSHPSQHTLLAAVVVAQDGITADAYATAMMVRGLAYAQELVAKQAGLAAFLIYKDENGAPAFYISPNLSMLQKPHTISLQWNQEAA